MRITEQLLELLESWKCKGERFVEIRFDRNDKVWTIWVYDYNLAAGTFIRDVTDVENISALIIKKKKKKLLSELEKLESSNEMVS